MSDFMNPKINKKKSIKKTSTSFKVKKIDPKKISKMFKTNSAIKILKNLLLKIIENFEMKRLLDENNGKNAPDMLIEFIDNINSDYKKAKYDEYEIGNIIVLLKQMPGFQRFVKYNMIDDMCLKLAVANIKLVRLKKNEYIFKEGTRTKEFFGIIKGLISIRKNDSEHDDIVKEFIKKKKFELEMSLLRDKDWKKSKQLFLKRGTLKRSSTVNELLCFSRNRSESKGDIIDITQLKKVDPNLREKDKSVFNWLSPNEIEYLETYHEHEIITMGEGETFGEWGLLYNIPRTASAKAKEDSILFSIDKDAFDKALSKSLLKAETERKKFILQKIPAFTQMPFEKFDDFYRQIITIFCKYKDVIYTDTMESGPCYLIYQGACKIQKNFLNKTKKEASILDMKLTTVMNLEKGDLTGLENIAGVPNYQYTLVASSDAVLFRFNLNNLAAEYTKNIIPIFKNLYSQKSEFIQSILVKLNSIKNRMKINYRNLNATIQSSSIVSYDNMKVEEKIEKEENSIKYFNQLQTNKIPINDGKKLLLKAYNLKSPILLNSHTKNPNETLTIESSYFKGAKMTIPVSIYKKDMKTAILSLKNQKIHNFDKDFTIFKNVKSQSDMLNKLHIKQSIANFSASQHLTTRNITNNENSIDYLKTDSCLISPIKNTAITINEENNTFLESENRLMSLNNCETLIRSKGYKQSCKEIKYSESPQEPVIKNERILSNLKLWENMQIKKKSPFNTGSFNLPLVVLKKPF